MSDLTPQEYYKGISLSFFLLHLSLLSSEESPEYAARSHFSAGIPLSPSFLLQQ